MTATKKKLGRPPKAVTANDVMRLCERLEPDERAALRRLGAVVPEGTSELDDPSESVWGLRCANCNKVALRFLGTSWRGQPVPPAGVKLSELAWTQDLIEPNRAEPNCQYCGAGPNLGIGGGLKKPGAPHFGIVLLSGAAQLPEETLKAIFDEYEDLVPDYEAAIKHSFSPAEMKRVRQMIAAMGGGLHGSSNSFTTGNQPIQSTIDRVAVTGRTGVEGTNSEATTTMPGGQPSGRVGQVMEQVAGQGGLNAAVAGGFRPGS